MKGIQVKLKWLPYTGTALFPFILIRKKDLPVGDVLINHERIHLQQQLELLLIPFYILYFTSYVFYRLKGLKHNAAYRSICFEKEAYQHEKNMNYLKGRKAFAFMSYL